jgi:riboflavin kinase/FMN adenylyltransferase
MKNYNSAPITMALGYFDGIHLGHQEVIRKAKEEAESRGVQSAVMTFYPHPSVVLGHNTQKVYYLTPMMQKRKIIEQLGIDLLYIVSFDLPFAHLTPQQFVDDYIIGLNVCHVIAGFDFSFGRKGEGTMETMPFHSRGKFKQTVVDKIEKSDRKISSTLIRGLIRDGAVEDVKDYLGRNYQIEGLVIDGEKRGRTIGFPTANIECDTDYLLPATGVYAVRMKVGSEWYNGVSNIGYKPTFKNEKPERPTIEVHLFDFNQSIYGETVTIEWIKRIRGEKKFESIDKLVQQINQDASTAKQYFRKHN